MLVLVARGARGARGLGRLVAGDFVVRDSKGAKVLTVVTGDSRVYVLSCMRLHDAPACSLQRFGLKTMSCEERTLNPSMHTLQPRRVRFGWECSLTWP